MGMASQLALGAGMRVATNSNTESKAMHENLMILTA